LKLAATPSRCTIEATDLEIGVRLDVAGVQADAPVQFLLPANRLIAILRETAEETVTVETGDPTTLIRAGQSEFELNAEDPANFPEVPTPRSKQHHTVTAGQLRDAIRRTTFAAAKDNAARYALTGTLWELDEKELRLVATDGKRLAVARCQAQAHGGNEPPGKYHIVPTKAMQLLERLLDDREQTVKVALRENEALIRVGAAVIHTRLLEGKYPPYRDILPKTKKVEIPLAVGIFHSVIRQAAVLADRESQGVEFTFKDNILTLETRSPDAGRSKVQLAIEYSGEPVTVALDPKFVTDALRVLPADQTIALELTDPKRPILFRHGPSYSYLVMPLC
jgi:DNA polymerase-3 subunit beta